MASGLAQRVLSALAMLPPVAAAVWFGAPWIDILIALAVGILGWEWALLTTGRFTRPAQLLMTAALVAAVVLLAIGLGVWSLAAIAVACLGGALLGQGRERGWLALGALYLGPAALSFAWLRHRPDGLEVICWLLAAVWATDIFAYAVGRAVGGPKLWPAVSPKKTWAGLLGGVAFAALAGAAFAWWMTDRTALELALYSAGLALVAQAGDLAESAVKRHFGKKDASSLIPGHGGLLDRVDGLLAASLALAIALWLAEH